jgi:hypothetical protein
MVAAMAAVQPVLAMALGMAERPHTTTVPQMIALEAQESANVRRGRSATTKKTRRVIKSVQVVRRTTSL